MKRLPLLASFVLFIALCASAAYWTMQLFKPPVRPVVAPPQTMQADVNPDAAAGLFGGHAAVFAIASNFQLKGVVAANDEHEGIAILSSDGKPAQAARVNAEIMPGVRVKEVHAQYVLLSEGGVVKRVDLPESAKGQAKGDFSMTAAPMPGQTASFISPTVAGNPVPPAQAPMSGEASFPTPNPRSEINGRPRMGQPQQDE